VIGLDDAGKTTSVKILKGDSDIKDMSPTVGFEPHQVQYSGVDIVLNDLGGGARVRDIWKHYLAESYGFIFVLDASNRNRIYECSKVFSTFVENEKVGSKPVLIIANKQELPNAMDESEIVQYLNVEELVNKFQIPCRIESCTVAEGVGSKMDEAFRAGFDWLVKYIVLRQEELKTRIDFDVGMQRGRESRITSEKYDKIRERRELEKLVAKDWMFLGEFRGLKALFLFSDDDLDEFEKNGGSIPMPWKTGSSKSSTKVGSSGGGGGSGSGSESKLSAYDKQLLEEMRGATPSNPRLTTIDEERSKLKNQRTFMKSNKLAPFDDRSELPVRNGEKDRSWAMAGQ